MRHVGGKVKMLPKLQIAYSFLTSPVIVIMIMMMMIIMIMMMMIIIISSSCSNINIIHFNVICEYKKTDKTLQYVAMQRV